MGGRNYVTITLTLQQEKIKETFFSLFCLKAKYWCITNEKDIQTYKNTDI